MERRTYQPLSNTYWMLLKKVKSNDMATEEKKTLWSTRIPLDKVHSLRTDINICSDRVTKDLLLQYNVELLVALLRLYLLELPQCLFTFELYDAAHALYSNSGQDMNLLLSSVSHLIASLPAPHFESLRQLMTHINRYIKDNDIPDETVTAISQALGPVIIRSNKETLTTSTSRIPLYLTKDLIKHYDTTFSAATIQAQADSEKRRQARPLVVNDDSAPVSPTTIDPAPSNSKRRSGIMSFMRSGNSNMEDSKWSLGVFRSNSQYQQTSGDTATTTTTTLPTKHTFTPSTITHDSPPLLPQKDDAIISPTQAMFDDNDRAIQRSSSNTTTAAEAILDDIDGGNDDHHELDPFFDDD
ncbi:unnamed protein product [Absidia cylindrospora]